jgi:hypothetical protein
MRTLLLSATAVAIAAGAPAFADHHKGKMAKGDHALIEREGDQIKLSDRAISGNELLNADLVDALQPIGSVNDVILNDEGKIAFIGYETSRFRDLSGEGYLQAGDMKLSPDSGFEIDVSINNIDAERPQKTMRLDEQEQETQMLSNILRDEIQTESGIYDVRDVVFSPEGQAEYIIASKSSGGFLTEGETFAVPFGELTYSDGAWRSASPEMEVMIVAFSQ